MNRPEHRDDRSHGEEYPGGGDSGTPHEEERYGAKPEPPKPDRRTSGDPKPAAPPPGHERNS
jgi:hypothetical protein